MKRLLDFWLESQEDPSVREQNEVIIKASLMVYSFVGAASAVGMLFQLKNTPEPYFLLGFCAAGWWLLRRGMLMTVGFAIPLFSLSLLTYRLPLTNGIHDTLMPGYLLVIIFASLVFGRRMAGLFVALCLVSVGWVIGQGVAAEPVVERASFRDLPVIGALFVATAVLASIIVTNLKNTLLRLRESEQALARVNSELERQIDERTHALTYVNQEMESFFYSLSHDLRAPLRSVNGFAKILQEDFSAELSPQARDYLGRIFDSGQKMGLLIDELLAFSRVGRNPLRIQVVDMNEIVLDALNTLKPQTQKRAIEWQLGKLPPSMADQQLIQRVYLILLGNAIKFTRNRETAYIEVDYFEQDGKTIYFVRDNGAGFDMQYADQLFGVFHRLHRDDEFEGIGIGLAIARRIIWSHGGRIWAHGEVGNGAAFYFTLGERNLSGVDGPQNPISHPA